ncbi:MAG: type VI secretion system contractile sheath small subunit [Myxococcales bacterium]|nr:type VI secretion system contractile sheath small subunit [Myxococcales bacterium]
MSKQQTVAPKERVNITYKPATGDAQEDVELPLKILALGDYAGKPSDAPIEERKAINIDKDNFDEVLAEQKISLDLAVPDALSEESGSELAVHLEIRSMKDFGPEAIAEQVPELKQLLELRQALTAVKGPLGNVPAFRKKLQEILGSDDGRGALMKELGLDAE